MAAARCATGPSLGEYEHTLRQAAGPDAADCGLVAYGTPRGDAVTCAEAALAAERPFSVAFQVPGVNSTIYVGVARRADGGAAQLVWDSDVHGGWRLVARREMYAEACREPRVSDKRDGSPVQCVHDAEASR